MGAAGTAEILTEITQKIVKYTTPFGYAWYEYYIKSIL